MVLNCFILKGPQGISGVRGLRGVKGDQVRSTLYVSCCCENSFIIQGSTLTLTHLPLESRFCHWKVKRQKWTNFWKVDCYLRRTGLNLMLCLGNGVVKLKAYVSNNYLPLPLKALWKRLLTGFPNILMLVEILPLSTADGLLWTRLFCNGEG